MARLLLNEKGTEREVDLTQPVVHIGRGSDNQVVIGDDRASRRHCRLSQTPQGWVLEDMKSRNGTLLNGVGVERDFLKDGDEFSIGKTRFRFLEHARKAEEEPAPSIDDDRLILPPEDAPLEETPAPLTAALAGPGDFFLEGAEGAYFGRRIPIREFPFTIGRRKDNDFAITDKRASGRHARIVERGSRYYLEDLGSRNGTLLNHKKVRGGVLIKGSLIRIGDSSFRVEMPQGEEPEAPPAAVEPEEDGQGAAVDFTRFDVREFLREGDRASPLSVAAVLLVLGILLYFAVDVTLKSVGHPDPDPPVEGNAVANWSFEEWAEGAAVPGWALSEGSQGTIALSGEGAQYPGLKALRLKPAGAGLTRAVSSRDITIDPQQKYRVAAHVTNLGSFAAGVSVTWLIEAGGKRVEVGRDWGAALREEVRGEDLERTVVPPPSAVFARVMPFAIDPEGGGGGGGAAFDRIFFAPDGDHPDPSSAEGTESTTGTEPPAGESEEAALPQEVKNRAEDGAIPGGGPAGAPIRLEVAADGTFRSLRRGGRVVLQSLWVGLSSDADPLALGPRLQTRLKSASDREGIFFLSQLPDTKQGEWFPLETRVLGQGGEIRCEFRVGRSRSKEGASADRVLAYLEVPLTLKEVMAFGGSLKSPATFPPDRPIASPIEELQFGTEGEQTVLLFKPQVVLRSLPNPDMQGRMLLAAEAVLEGDPEERGRKGATGLFSLRISPVSRREDEAAAALLKDAAQLHSDGKPAEAMARLRELETRFSWRAADIARTKEMVKGWNEEAERTLKDIQSSLEDLRRSLSPVIRDALLARIEAQKPRFQETPLRDRLEDLGREVRTLVPELVPGSEAPRETLLKEARSRLDRGEIGLADLCLKLARETKLSSEDEESLGQIARIVAERRKQRAVEEVR